MQSNSIYSASVNVTIERFNPTESPFPILATLSAPIPSPDTPNNVFSGDGEEITIQVPKGFSGTVNLVFQLNDPLHVLLGIAFAPNKNGVGRSEFPSIQVQRSAANSSLTITDAYLAAASQNPYTYVILVQEVVSGRIGVIDPSIETEVDG